MEGPKLEWGRDLPGEMLEKWPKDENGELCCRRRTSPAARSSTWATPYLDRRARLLRHTVFQALSRTTGDSETLMLGMSAEGVDIFVPETMLEEAKNILEGESEDEEL